MLSYTQGTIQPIQLTDIWEKFVTASWNNINDFAILKYLNLNTLLSFQLYRAVSCWLKALGIWTEGLWIRADFLYEYRLTLPQITQFSCIFNDCEIQHLSWELNIKKLQTMTKYKIKATKCRYFGAVVLDVNT